MNRNLKLLYPGFVAVTALVILSSLNTVLAQSQALTPEQLTQQIRVLNDRSKNTASVVSNIELEVKKMSRLVDNRAMLELMQNVDELASEISLLRGELEQQNHDITEIKKRQRELYLDIDRRMRDLESRAPTQAPSSAPVEVPGLSGVTEETPTIEPVESVASTTGTTSGTGLISDSSTPVTSSQQSVGAATNSAEQAAYQSAFDTLKEGRYKKAKAEFKRFLQKYPDSSFAGNSQYWLGEANYVTRNFEQGIIEFELVLSRYPSSSKVPDAMLKLGYTYYEKKQYNKAKIMLSELRKRYPKATAARLAGKRLDRMRKEGH